MRVVATAGHVDHGKSTLVLALTGTDPDRLAEEKARGLTIDLGFAAGRLPSGAEIAFVDVPGHVRFIKNMLAGVGAVDACLFVVAATEGWKPQSEEHLRILELLGITHGRDRLDQGRAGRRRVARAGRARDPATTWPARSSPAPRWSPSTPSPASASTRLQGRPRPPGGRHAGGRRPGLAPAVGRPVVPCPGRRHGGDRHAHRRKLQPWTTRWRSSRAACPPGSGACTATTLDLDRATPGRRLAINLAGVSHDRVGRGQAVVRPGQWHRATVVDASLAVLASVGHRVARRGAYAAYLGSGEQPVRVRVLGSGGSIAPGEEGFVRLWLAPGTALPLLPGDRYVLREAGRVRDRRRRRGPRRRAGPARVAGPRRPAPSTG